MVSFKLFLENISLIPDNYRKTGKVEADGVSFKKPPASQNYKSDLHNHLTNLGYKRHPYSDPEHELYTKDNNQLHIFHQKHRIYLSYK